MSLPNMDVEVRVSTTAHTVPVPDESLANMCSELTKAIKLNKDGQGSGDPWPSQTLLIIMEYCKLTTTPTPREIRDAVRDVLGFNSWAKLSKFVVDDMCLDFFNLCLRYLIRVGAEHKNDLDFIDGSGIGYVKTYIERLKVTLEQAFDAKYFYQVKRPLVFALEDRDLDLVSTANAIHPGHWSYPAGHGTKFFTAVEVLNDIFNLTTQQYRSLFIAAHTAAMGRSGNLIHYPVDNDAGGYLTTLPEYNP